MTNLFCRYYSDVGLDRGLFKVSIDSSTPQQLTAKRNSTMSQQLLWSNTSLGPGKHIVTLTNDDPAGLLGLDFFRSVIHNCPSVQGSESRGCVGVDDSSTLPAGYITGNQNPGYQNPGYDPRPGHSFRFLE